MRRRKLPPEGRRTRRCCKKPRACPSVKSFSQRRFSQKRRACKPLTQFQVVIKANALCHCPAAARLHTRATGRRNLNRNASELSCPPCLLSWSSHTSWAGSLAPWRSLPACAARGRHSPLRYTRSGRRNIAMNGVVASFEPVGSRLGVEKIARRLVDFGAGDTPLGPTELQRLSWSAWRQPTCKAVVKRSGSSTGPSAMAARWPCVSDHAPLPAPTAALVVQLWADRFRRRGPSGGVGAWQFAASISCGRWTFVASACRRQVNSYGPDSLKTSGSWTVGPWEEPIPGWARRSTSSGMQRSHRCHRDRVRASSLPGGCKAPSTR